MAAEGIVAEKRSSIGTFFCYNPYKSGAICQKTNNTCQSRNSRNLNNTKI